ncbi:hypothetical protein [Natronosalvus amylolyticus]|uniref:hypothetical protein n=1 Tax=Natronosalvus amylolyticus TaxID=2961994 RepID=UPI0020C98A1E|nr:hypothetical protein [Natronosalvus amylolyticus]
MTRDFTFEMYEKLLQAGLEAGYHHLTVREYLSRDNLPERFIIHRHDVDRKPENSLAMARLEARYGISSTYYFRTIEKTFKPKIIREIESLGHEIGYHYEDLDRASGDVDAAHESFSRELEKVRSHVTVDTVCMHGNPLTSYDNRDMWTRTVPFFRQYDLDGEAYLSMSFETVSYFSDTGRTWKDGLLKIKDHAIGIDGKSRQVRSTSELTDLIQSRSIPRYCILTHPNRWAKTRSELVVETTKDLATNIAKIGIQTFK